MANKKASRIKYFGTALSSDLFYERQLAAVGE